MSGEEQRDEAASPATAAPASVMEAEKEADAQATAPPAEDLEMTDNGPNSQRQSPSPPQEGEAPGPSGAEEFTDSRMLRPQPALARRGWRRWANLSTGGLIKLGRSAAEEREAQRMARATRPTAGSRRILVVSRKGGVGKTTVTLMLGHAFATLRGDRVVALDGDPDGGSLGYRVRRETSASVKRLLDDHDSLESYTNIRGYTSQAPTRLEVVAAHDDPTLSQALGYDDYQQAIRVLDKHYNLLLLDSGALDGATQGMLELADQLIVVLAPSLDAARSASMTLDWLHEHGYGHLVAEAVAVINQVRDKVLLKHKVFEEHFQRRCRSTVRIPWDPNLEVGGETAFSDLLPATRSAYLDLAAEVADGFPESARNGTG
ncbi:MAG: AAA family ATPase [Nitriliruptorales bacterium]|nr:AAA family ATPase [Nitriliruptorales bacterium]